MALSNRVGSLAWRQSSFCKESGCVEVAFSGGAVFVRDSKSPNDSILEFSGFNWQTFLYAAMTGKFDFHDSA